MYQTLIVDSTLFFSSPQISFCICGEQTHPRPSLRLSPSVAPSPAFIAQRCTDFALMVVLHKLPPSTCQ